jgi:hypothetical protein
MVRPCRRAHDPSGNKGCSVSLDRKDGAFQGALTGRPGGCSLVRSQRQAQRAEQYLWCGVEPEAALWAAVNGAVCVHAAALSCCAPAVSSASVVGLCSCSFSIQLTHYAAGGSAASVEGHVSLYWGVTPVWLLHVGCSGVGQEGEITLGGP